MSNYTGAVPDSPRAEDWRKNAACAGEDPDTFFPRGAGPAAQRQTRHAKVICFRCPSQPDCAQWAIDNRIGFGVFGGMSESERRTILRRRGVRLIEDPDLADAV